MGAQAASAVSEEFETIVPDLPRQPRLNAAAVPDMS